MKTFIILALGASASMAVAQSLSDSVSSCAYFINMTWANGFVQDVKYTISWDFASEQCMGPVSANLISGNYSQPIFSNYTSSTSFLWTVPIIIPGNYSMELLDGSASPDESPEFQIYAAPSSTVSAAPTSTVMAASGTGTGISATPYIYYDDHCGCTRTAMAPAVSRVTGAMSYTAPSMTAPISPQFTSAAGRINIFSGSAGIAVILLAAAFAA